MSLPTGQAGMKQLSHTGMTPIAIGVERFHSLPRSIGVTSEKQIINT
ncbi:hypothetical protein [Mongoliibacter sp.]|nr:hypothetical protein [Mongoliibacter sp.]